MSIKNIKARAVKAGAVLLLGGVMVLAPATSAHAYLNDGTSWASCTGRWVLNSTNLINGLGQNVGRVQVNICNNGVFTHTTSTRHTSVYATIIRDKPYWTEQYRSGYGYAITSNMVARVKGGCYWAYGSAGGVGMNNGRGHYFCLY